MMSSAEVNQHIAYCEMDNISEQMLSNHALANEGTNSVNTYGSVGIANCQLLACLMAGRDYRF